MGWDTYKPGDAGKVLGTDPGQPASGSGQTGSGSGQSGPDGAKAGQDGPPAATDDGYHWYSRPFKEGVGTAALNAGIAFGDSATGGQIPRLESWAGMDPSSTLKLIDKAHNDLGVYDYLASGAGYAVGPGKVVGALKTTGAGLRALEALSKAAPDAASLAAKYAPSIAKYVPENLVPGMVASGAENAAASALGTEGHMGSASDVAKSALTGGAIGTLAGATGGGSYKSGQAPNIGPTGAALAATEDQAWRNAGNINYHPMSVNRAVTGAERDISSLSPRDQYEGQNTLANLQALRDEARRGPVSAERLKDYLDKFNYANSGDAVPNAGLSAQAQVNSLLNRPGMTGVAGAPAVAAGRDASSRAFAGKTMDDWMTQAGLPKGSGSAAFPGRARAELANNPQFYGPGETQALKNLAATGPNVGSGNHFISPWLIRHAVAYPVAGAAIGAAHSALSDDSSAEHIPWWQEALVGAGLVGAHTAAKGMLANRARTQAFNNTRYTLTTGKTPQSTPLQDMIRAGVFGQGATGQN